MEHQIFATFANFVLLIMFQNDNQNIIIWSCNCNGIIRRPRCEEMVRHFGIGESSKLEIKLWFRKS